MGLAPYRNITKPFQLPMCLRTYNIAVKKRPRLAHKPCSSDVTWSQEGAKIAIVGSRAVQGLASDIKQSIDGISALIGFSGLCPAVGGSPRYVRYT